jgi:hypothetical protein
MSCFPSSKSRDFALEAASETTLLKEYRSVVRKTAIYRDLIGRSFTKLLAAEVWPRASQLAETIMEYQTAIVGLNTRLHYVSKGEAVVDFAGSVAPMTLHQSTTENQLKSFIRNASERLTPDFTFEAVRELHRLAAGVDGTDPAAQSSHRSADSTHERDLCSVMERPADLQELQASEALWEHATKLRQLVRRTFDLEARGTDAALPLPSIIGVIVRGMRRKAEGGTPYHCSLSLRTRKYLTGK